MQLDQIIQGDCVELLAKLDEGSIDLVFADPPFNIGYDYDKYDDDRSCEQYLDWSKQWMEAAHRALKPTGTFWLAIGDDYAAELKVIATRELGFTCRSWVIWYYTFGVNCKNKFSRSHTHLFHFVKDAKSFTFNDLAIRVPSARQLVYGDKRANPKGRLPDDTWLFPALDEPQPKTKNPDKKSEKSKRLTHEGWTLRPQDLPEGFSPDSDTWYYPRVCGTFKERLGFHGCQMPERILERIIRVSSNEGDCVVDPFSGSATTLAVARKLGRKFLGFELSEDYVQKGQARLGKVNPGDEIDGVLDPLTSVPNTKNGTIRTPKGERIKSAK